MSAAIKPTTTGRTIRLTIERAAVLAAWVLAATDTSAEQTTAEYRYWADWSRKLARAARYGDLQDGEALVTGSFDFVLNAYRDACRLFGWEDQA